MTPALQTAGWALVHFVWQGAAIAAAVAIALRLLERRSPNARYIVACAGLAAMLAAPIATARLVWMRSAQEWESRGASALSTSDHRSAPEINAPSSRPDEASASAAAAFEDSRSVDVAAVIERVLPAVTIVWLAGVVVLLARIGGGWVRVRRLHRTALATPSSHWQLACRRLAYRLGLPAAAHVVETSLVDVPTVVGCLRPAILLPIAALASLSTSQVEAILAHELAHIRRHDYAVNVLQTIGETLLFYHPAVWWLSNRIRAEREHCCDGVAVRVCGDPVGYAQALAELEEWRVASASIAMAATGGSLVDRVHRILRAPLDDEPRSTGWAATLALTLIFAAGAGSVERRT